MSKKQSKQKKENTLAGSIILLIVGVLVAVFGGDYLWVLFHVIEIPLPILA